MSSYFTFALYIITFGALGVLAVRDRTRAHLAVKVAIKSLLGILPSILVIVGLIGLLTGLVPTEFISRYLGQGSGWWATVTATLLGAILYIPSLVSYPLGASLLKAGASLATVAAFITALVMVGTVTLPMEIKQLGKRMALGRNLLSLLFAFLIALVIGMVLQ